MKGCTSICKSEKEFDVSQIQNKPSRPLEIELCDINKTELHSLVSIVNGNGTTFNRHTFKIGMPQKNTVILLTPCALSAPLAY